MKLKQISFHRRIQEADKPELSHHNKGAKFIIPLEERTYFPTLYILALCCIRYYKFHVQQSQAQIEIHLTFT